MSADRPALPYRPAVGILLLNKRGLVLAGERKGMAEAWQMPQGGVDAGEKPEEAAWRELAEETGITEAEMLRSCTSKYTYDFPKTHAEDKWRGQEQLWYAMRFTGDEEKVDVTRVEKPEFSRHKWFAPAEMLRRIVAFKRPVYQNVFSEFADLLGR